MSSFSPLIGLEKEKFQRAKSKRNFKHETEILTQLGMKS